MDYDTTIEANVVRLNPHRTVEPLGRASHWNHLPVWGRAERTTWRFSHFI